MSESYEDIEDYLYDPDKEIKNMVSGNREIFYRVVNLVALITYIVLFVSAVYVMTRSFTETHDALYLHVASLMVFWIAPVVIAIIYLFTDNMGIIILVVLVAFLVSILGLSSYQISTSTDNVTLGLSSTYTAMTSIVLLLWFVALMTKLAFFYKKRYVYGVVKTEEFGSDEIDF